MTSSELNHDRTVLREEELEPALARLVEFAVAAGASLRDPDSDGPTSSLLGPGGIQDELVAGLRSVLEAEIIPAVVTSDDADIQPIDLDHELAKKALTVLRLPMLRRVAAELGVLGDGGLDEVTARIAASVHWNQAEIARLVLGRDVVPRAERSHSLRLFPLLEEPDLEYVEDRLAYVVGRYIRTGIAKWFVFQSLEASDDRLLLQGTLRSFKADVLDGEEPTVVPVEREDRTVEVEIDRSAIITVRRGNAAEATAAVRALAAVSNIVLADGIQPRTGGVRGEAVSFAATTLFMLDLVSARLVAAGFQNRNLTLARFRVDDRLPSDETSTAPRLKSVRFDGDHLLDSSTACKLIAQEARSLVDVALTARLPGLGGEDPGNIPMRVSIERDQVLVMTGFGMSGSQSFDAHRRLVEAVRAELTEGIVDPSGLNALAERVAERARSFGSVDEADMLSDDEDE